MLKEFIRNPFYVIITVIITWWLLKLILIRFNNLTPTRWAQLEYIWIIIGFIGVISIVNQNNLIIKKNELAFSERWIESEFESLLTFTEKESNCFQYTRSSYLDKEEFDKRQAESDRLCLWIKNEVIPVLRNSKNESYSKIKDYPKIKLDHYEGSYTPKRIRTDIKKLNENIEDRNILRNDISSNIWEGFQATIGVIFLVIAFGLRLTLVSKKINDTKTRYKYNT